MALFFFKGSVYKWINTASNSQQSLLCLAGLQICDFQKARQEEEEKDGDGVAFYSLRVVVSARHPERRDSSILREI